LAKLRVNVTAHNTHVLQQAHVVVLGVKPHIIPHVLNEINEHIRTNKHLVISIAAGVTIKTMQQALPTHSKIVRVMPNTPCLVAASASAYSLGPHCTDHDQKIVQQLLDVFGIQAHVPEYQLDAVTGISGSGPAYIAMVIEALADGAVEMGLPRVLANQFARQTVYGTAKMVTEGRGCSLCVCFCFFFLFIEMLRRKSLIAL
jgi:pyrroline-5-carboxylate reductase